MFRETTTGLVLMEPFFHTSLKVLMRLLSTSFSRKFIPNFLDPKSFPLKWIWNLPHPSGIAYYILILDIISSCDSNMPEGVNQKITDNVEARERFKDWDPRLATNYFYHIHTLSLF